MSFVPMELLRQLDIHKPSQGQIETMGSFISFITCEDGEFVVDEILSSREKECLYWAAWGKTTYETAEILRIKTSTVETYRNNIKKKLNCHSIAQAVFYAMKYRGPCCPICTECEPPVVNNI